MKTQHLIYILVLHGPMSHAGTFANFALFLQFTGIVKSCIHIKELF